MPSHSLKFILILCIGLVGACANGNKSGFPGKGFFSAPFRITIEANDKLEKKLEEELSRQRKNNRKLQQYDNPIKVSRYQKQLLEKKLLSEGYYQSQIDITMEEDVPHYRVFPGARYTVSRISLKSPDNVMLSLDDLGVQLQQGAPLRAATILEDVKNIEQRVARRACLLRVNVDYDVKVYHQTHTAEVSYQIAKAPSVNFGQISFEGLETVEESYLKDRISIKEQQCFVASKLDQAKLELFQTNLIASAIPSLSEPHDGEVDLVFSVTERKHRTFSAGVLYHTDDGGGISLGWEHRNLLGEAEKFEIETLLSENRQSVNTSLTIPQFISNDRVLRIFSTVETEQTDAFDTQTGLVGLELSRQLSRFTKASLGGEVNFSEVTEDGDSQNFALLSLPLTIEYDRRDAPLDPRKGYVLTARTTPYWDAYDTSTRFVKSTIAASAYISSNSLPLQPTLAVRTAVGTISGLAREEVPANIRFYAGGGGSVRGYEFQSLGPLSENEPLGGLSFRELSVETRFRIGESWGAVLFVDGGFAYADKTPEAFDDLLYAGGFGIRYFTSFAPIRFDVAFPLDRREGIDDSFQLYVSIGQAF